MAKYVDKAVIVDMLRTKAELGRASGYGACYDNAAKMVELLPAADVAPVRRGSWKEWWPGITEIMTGEEMLYRCSACDAKYADIDGYKYCPHCGAKMDKEDA